MNVNRSAFVAEPVDMRTPRELHEQEQIETALQVDWLCVFAAVNGLDSLHQHGVSSDRHKVFFEVRRVEAPGRWT
jgi:hypothetical protein